MCYCVTNKPKPADYQLHLLLHSKLSVYICKWPPLSSVFALLLLPFSLPKLFSLSQVIQWCQSYHLFSWNHELTSFIFFFVVVATLGFTFWTFNNSCIFPELCHYFPNCLFPEICNKQQYLLIPNGDSIVWIFLRLFSGMSGQFSVDSLLP